MASLRVICKHRALSNDGAVAAFVPWHDKKEAVRTGLRQSADETRRTSKAESGPYSRRADFAGWRKIGARGDFLNVL
jgi:hypothetical protein